MKHTLLNILLPLFITTAFAKEAKAQPAKQNLNISFLLDLSDRIDPKKNPGIYQRDLQYIKSVQKAFTNHVKGKKMLLLKDQMQVFFNPLPNIPNIDQLSDQLKVSFSPQTSKKDFLNIEKLYTDNPTKIYQRAIKDHNYVGSDIWKFFKNNIREYCIKPQHRNILVILTDGYMYYKDSKIENAGKSSYITPQFLSLKKLTTASYQAVMKQKNLGFIAFPYNLKDLEIIVLGINPSIKNPYEEDVIKQYWADWFKAMKVKKFELRITDLPSSIEPIINNFIQ
ncbi:hypothetical protein SAMN05421827_103119 [Pedobacter terrae]|uniref:VWFA domain-containing protein n=1 Tax=Pedobacter terrae TaxID=405671 RepID=A0A1G7R806_9SPHI|nr:hypothetical protein [Pedobacter terrae]SDG06853.1 hypothetical protein SAMN05421827_103119 [Pedobacter terrae]